jgi:hypothetical protein
MPRVPEACMSEIRTAPNRSTREGAEREAAPQSVERWLVIVLLSLVPMVAALFVPLGWRAPLYIAGGAACAVGLALLVVHEVKRSKEQGTD